MHSLRINRRQGQTAVLFNCSSSVFEQLLVEDGHSFYHDIGVTSNPYSVMRALTHLEVWCLHVVAAVTVRLIMRGISSQHLSWQHGQLQHRLTTDQSAAFMYNGMKMSKATGAYRSNCTPWHGFIIGTVLSTNHASALMYSRNCVTIPWHRQTSWWWWRKLWPDVVSGTAINSTSWVSAVL
jgi:hypothetical protein